jgi:hypothetical protein
MLEIPELSYAGVAMVRLTMIVKPFATSRILFIFPTCDAFYENSTASLF